MATLHNTCIITGKECFVRPDVLQKRIEKYGSEERLNQLYICREAASLLKEGRAVQEVRKLLGSDLTAEVPQEALDMIKEAAGKKTALGRVAQVAKAMGNTDEINSNGEPVMIFKVNRGSLGGYRASDITDPESIRTLTNSACAFPNMRVEKKCKACKFTEHCIAPCKL